MITKYLFLIFSFLFSGATEKKDISQSLKAEILNIGFKFLVGIVLVALIIYSMLQLGNVFNMYLSKFENPLQLAVLSFGALGLTGFVLLILLFNKSLYEAKRRKAQAPPDLQAVALKFVEGFMRGLK